MKKVKADDYYNDGVFELARFGNTVVSSNHMTEEQHALWIRKIAESYEPLVEEINDLVARIRELVGQVGPENLLNYLVSMNMFASLNKTSEIDYSADLNCQLRSVEYVQSVLVSSPNIYEDNKEVDNKDESIYADIMRLSTLLYGKMQYFYMVWAAKAESEHAVSDDELKYLMLAQPMALVRGNQYQNFRIQVLSALINPHNEEIKEIYGISSKELIDGLKVMEHNLSSGRLDAAKKMRTLMDRLPDFFDNLPDDYQEEAHETMMQMIGLDLFDVKKHTKWPDSLIEDLSLEIDSDSSFYDHELYSGWPIWELPVQRRPFIRLSGVNYCFDYYNFFDNFYRALQTAIFSKGTAYVERWKKSQTDASENIVGNIFSELLPGCNVYRSNHYKIKGGSAENDLIIEYKDVLFVIEVKGASFTYTPAILDLSAHKVSINNLIQKAEKQCIRVKKYIESSPEVMFYKDDALKEYSFSLRKGDYSQIYMFAVTVDDINEIAAAIEKIEIADAKEDIISISIDDLWVYKDYFDSPIEFIHFIEQRTMATRASSVYTFDELDHLGLYINHNMYTLQADGIANGMPIHFNGYREDLDRYYADKLLGKKTEKPRQSIPSYIEQIINKLVIKEGIKNPLQITNFLLDLSSDTKSYFAESISSIALREKELGRMIPAISFGDASYSLFVNIPGITVISQDERKDYVEANLIKSGSEACYYIYVSLDDKGRIADVDATLYKTIEIDPERVEKLKAFGDRIVSNRIEMFRIRDNKKKIYPNEPCPCGSGKKYKKCCGRK